MNSIFGFMKNLAEGWLQSQEVKPEDYYDADNFLVCGICHERRQGMQELSDPTDTEPNRKSLLKVVRMCRCDREAADREKYQKKLEEDLERIKILKNASLIESKLSDATFENFKENTYNQRNCKLCVRYATAFDEMLKKNQGLLMWGGVGTGKSYAAACIANYLLEHMTPVVMTSFVKLLEIIQKDGSEEQNIINRLERAKLVIFDDLGAERSTGYALEKVYNIIDSRYRSGLPMIVTTNLTMEEMKSEDDMRYARIFDRIFEICYPMQFTGHSWRKVAAKERYDEMERFLLGEDNG